MALYHHKFFGTHTAADGWNFGWFSTGAASLAAAAAAADQWYTDFAAGSSGTNGWASVTTSVVASSGTTTVEIDPATGGQLGRIDTVLSIAGAAAGDSLPADVALVATLRGAQANRRNLGRFFLPSPAASTLDANGNVDAATITAVTGALTFADNGFSGTLSRTLYSRTDHLLRDVVSGDVGNRWDTLRRRDDIASEARTTWTVA